jgi:hypothetical protein
MSLAFVLLFASAAAQQGSVPTPSWFDPERVAPTYTEGAGLVYEMRCVSCHRPGGVVPMDLSSHQMIRRWAVGTTVPVKDAVLQGMMPPWPADPAVGSFADDPRLSAAEKELFAAFIDSGTPRGPGEFEPSRNWVDGWTIGVPDAVFELAEQTIAEEVEGELREIVVSTDFPEDRWVVATQVQPGDFDSVVLVDAGPLGAFGSANWLAHTSDGAARLLPAGADVTVRVLYRKRAGSTAVAATRIGVIFADDAQHREQVLDAPMRAEPFELKAEQGGVEVTSSFEFPAAGTIYSVMPVMHKRGASVEFRVVFPDDRVERLLSIPRWDPKWKFRYRLAAPLTVPAGAVVEVVAVFDNSFDNIKNPDPWSDVTSGPAGETLEGWLEYSLNAGR